MTILYRMILAVDNDIDDGSSSCGSFAGSRVWGG